MLASLLTGCAAWHPVDGSDHSYLEQTPTAAADSTLAESGWSVVGAEPQSPDKELHLAILQSVPGHTGYNPAGAEARLQALLATDPPAEIAVVARAQLTQLNLAGECHKENQQLRQGLAKMVKIERNLKDEH